MQRLTSIVAVNPSGVIGAANTLPWRVRSDLQFFRAQTINNVVIMGRRTYDSLGKPLPDRRNVVITHGFGFFASNEVCRVAGSIEEGLIVASYWTPKKRETFVVGGASMYEQFAPFVDRYLITRVEKDVDGADTFFDRPELGDPDQWSMSIIANGKANGTTDEANYTIYEFLRRDLSSVSRREAVFARWKNSKSANSLNLDFAQRLAV